MVKLGDTVKVNNPLHKLHGVEGKIYNPVSFIKNWMKEDTFINEIYAEKSLISHYKENIVSDAEYKEVQSDYDLE